MKKRFVLTLISVMALTLGACGTDAQMEEKEAGTDTEAVQEESTEVIVDTENAAAQVVTQATASTLEMEEDSVMASYEVDVQLQAELESGNYGWDAPLTVVNPYGMSPLTAVVLFQTEEPCKVRMTVEGHSDATDVTGDVTDVTTMHRVPVVGLYAGEMNNVTLTLLDANDTVLAEQVLQVQTDVLPKKLVGAVTVEQSNAASCYGMLEVSGFGTKTPFAFDTLGEVRWYLTGSYDSFGYFPLANEHFMITSAETKVQTAEKPYGQIMYEMDDLGRTYQIYLLEDGAHHEIIEKSEGGNLLVLTSTVDNYVEDSVVEIDRQTGEVVKRLDFEEMFAESPMQDRIDWCHLNTVSYDAASDSLLLSPRNIYSVIKVNWSTDELEWILADPTVWAGTPYEEYVLQPVGNIRWQYQQHSPYFVYEDLDNDPSTVQVMMYDNHWNTQRKIPTYDGSEYSYVSLYYINEEAKTVTLGKEFESAKSKITSNFRLNLEAGRLFSMGMWLAYPEENNDQNAMIYEYDFNTGEVLNQYSLSHNAYRSYEFVPNLDVYSVPLEEPGDYMLGHLEAFAMNENAAALPAEKLDWRNDEDEIFNMYVKMNMLFLHQKDHDITGVELIGEKNSYLRDYTNSVGTEEYEDAQYCLAVSMDGVAAGTYEIVVTYQGIRYDTGETVIIQ